MVLTSRYFKMLHVISTLAFLAYSIVLIGFNLAVFTIVILLTCVLVNHERVCRIIYLRYLDTIAIDLCGCLLPLAVSLFIALNSRIDLGLLAILLTLSITIASINTVLSSRSIVVNVLRHSISLFLLSLTLFRSYGCYFYILPLVSAIGIILGSDILPYVFMRPMLRNLKKILIIGGAKTLDAINISTILIMIMALTYIVLSRIL
ncbi:MAG: DUF1614 domain-containing protein [Ignisphaera sp.]|nr:DUF1614 domain-containing protein [Ignisphaera sp.]